MNNAKIMVSNFLDSVIQSASAQDVLLVSFTVPKILNCSTSFITEVNNASALSSIRKKRFDIAIVDLPLGIRSEPRETASEINANENWRYMLTAFQLLKERGQAFILIEPSTLYSRKGQSILRYSEHEGYRYNSVFELPEKLLFPQCGFVPILMHFERQKRDNLFIAKINDNHETIIKNLSHGISTNNIETGVFVDREKFTSFNKYRIEQEIYNLKTQYKEYNNYRIKEIALDITTVRSNDSSCEVKPNSVFIKRTRKPQVTTRIVAEEKQRYEYFKIVLNQEIVCADYFTLFFDSELGIKILNSLFSEWYFQKVNRSVIENCIIPIPTLSEQKLLIATNLRLSILHETVLHLRSELGLNPKNAKVLHEKLDNIQVVFSKLSNVDKIMSLIRKGESKHLEFKETFSKEIKTGRKENFIEKMSLKSIVGFLNADGGTLLIGVSDQGEVVGVNDDFFSSPDRYLLNFRNALHSQIGSEFYPLIDFDLYEISGLYLLKVDCKPSNMPCFLGKEEEFYVRTNPATDQLKGRKLSDYIRLRFP